MSEQPTQLNDEQKEELGIKRDFTQERKDRVIPAINEVYAEMAAFDFKHNFKTQDLDNKEKQESEHDRYRTFVAENMRAIILKHDLRMADVKYLIQLTTTVSNLVEEVTQEISYDERIIKAAHAIMAGLSKEAELAPTEKKHNKTEVIAKAEEKLIALSHEAQTYQQELVKKSQRGETLTTDETEKAEDFKRRLEFLKNYLEDLMYKESRGYVVFRDYMRRIVVPVFEEYDIKFHEAASVFAVISNVVDNVGKTLTSILESIKVDSETKLWGVEDLRNDLTVQKVLDILENKE